MTTDELKKALSTILKKPHCTQLYLILSFLNDLALVQKRSRICSLKTA